MKYITTKISTRPNAIESLFRHGHELGWDDKIFVPNEFCNYQIYDQGSLIIGEELENLISSKFPSLAKRMEPVNFAIKVDPLDVPKKFERMVTKDDYDHIIFGQKLPKHKPQQSYTRLETKKIEVDDSEFLTIPIQTWGTANMKDTIPALPRNMVNQEKIINTGYMTGHVVSDDFYDLVEPYLDDPFWISYDIDGSIQLLGPSEQEAGSFTGDPFTRADAVHSFFDSICDKISWSFFGLLFRVSDPDTLENIREKNEEKWKSRMDPFNNNKT